MLQRGHGTALVACTAFLAACSSLIGIEDLNEGPRPGDEEGGSSGTISGKGGSNGGSSGTSGGNAGTASGSGGASGKGGSSGSSGASATGGTAGSDGGTGGTTGGTGGDGGDDNMGGDTGMAGTMNEGGTGGTNPTDMTVRGRVLDYYRHPIPGLTVEVGGTEVVTDAQGEFVVEDVPATYDASFIVQRSNPSDMWGWVYQGLTRRDPTLYAYQGVDQRYMNTNLRAVDGAPTETQNLTLAIGSQHGSAQVANIPENGRDSVSFNWAGPAATAATAHGLMWDYDEATELPTNYISYDTFPIALDDSAATQTINVSVEPTTITQGNVSGTVTDTSPSGPVNYGFLRFTSGATVELFADDPGPATFSYLVPSIPNASVTIATSDEDWSTLELAVAHQAGVALGTTNLSLVLPATPSLTAPAPGATGVDATTSFRFQNRQAGVGAAVVVIEDNDFFQGIYIVTASTNITIPPILSGGFELRAGGEHYWTVENHGAYASVDEMTGPNGFMDSFAWNWYSPEGPNTSSGTYARSARRYFTVAP